VRTPDGDQVDALVYVATDDEAGRPKDWYIARIVDAARVAGFPKAYIAELQGFYCRFEISTSTLEAQLNERPPSIRKAGVCRSGGQPSGATSTTASAAAAAVTALLVDLVDRLRGLAATWWVSSAASNDGSMMPSSAQR